MNEQTITTDNVAELVAIVAELKSREINFRAFMECGKWIITLNGKY